MKVLILDPQAEAYAGRLRELFPALELHLAPAAAAIPIDLAIIDVLITFGFLIDDGGIGRAENLKWIQALTTGVDHFLALPSLRPEVLLTSTRGIHGQAMRETVAFLMLSLNHGAMGLARNQAAARWERRPWNLLCGRTATIVGVGVSGTAIAELLKALQMRVVGVTRTLRDLAAFDVVVHADRLAEIASETDYLINVLPASPQNTGLIGRAVFEAMKPTAYFINVGRGETVDEAAMIDALRAGRIAGAGLDVFEVEPLPPESPLWAMHNVVLSPHIGALFTEYSTYALPIVVENMRLFLDGRTREMRNIVEH